MATNDVLTEARPRRTDGARRHRRGLAFAGIIAVGALLLTGCWSTNQGRLMDMSNNARKANGNLPAVAGNQAAMDKAQKWTQHMADTGVVEHTGGGSKLDTRGLPKWCSVGETVGKGSSLQAVFDSFMRSSIHRGIILTRKFNRVGTGVVRKGTVVYATQIFYQAC
jgi:uncharacterized protein YkwD